MSEGTLETPEVAATSPTTTEPSKGKIARQNFNKFRANFNPAHTVATILRKTATVADKLPTPGEVARDVATRLDAIDPKATQKRIAELKALEREVESKFAAGSGK